MLIRDPRFTDPMYSADKFVEFDPADEMAHEERQISLLMRSKFWATYITLKSDAQYSLSEPAFGESAACRKYG
ncbi:hypothetical protein IAD21_02522 [Abditibacteriota bacterium]|nr:hypothetical protein IAD21_02522 [Abditibacteriota bacterium]